MKYCGLMSKALLAGAGLMASLAAQAEGSRSLYPAGYEAAYPDEGRANLTVSGSTNWMGVAPAKSLIYVYAQAGEVILVGSRNRTAAGTGAISGYAASQISGTKGNETLGTPSFTCSNGTDGLIDTRAKEIAGPQASVGAATGYTPCVWNVATTGIYGVLFSGTGNARANGAVNPPALAESGVSAWDVTVREFDAGNVYGINEKSARVFTYAWAADTGDNGAGRRIYSNLYYVTDDGYRYRQQLVGIDPNAGVFFANAFGFRDQGQPLYKNIRGQNQTVSSFRPSGISGVTADGPQYPLFFSDVTDANVEPALAALGIPLVPKPPQVNGFQFSYPPVSTSTSYVGQGGVFTFSVTDTMTYQIIISGDGVDWDPATATNRVLTGTSASGSYTANWDGNDNAGNNMPVGAYQFRITGRNGEVHFPFADVEGNLYGGPVITKLNGNITDAIVYYDDRGYKTLGGTNVGTLNGNICGNAGYSQPSPVEALAGIDSSLKNQNNGGGANSAYARWWPEGSNDNSDCAGAGQYFGDSKALNLWTYQTTLPQSNTLNIVDFADVVATVSAPVSTAPGNTVTTSVGFGNVGSQAAANTTYALQLPAGLSGVSCAGATCSYNPGSGVVTVSGLPASLSSGQWANLTLSYTAPASGNVPVVASVGTSTSQGDNLAPDSGSAITLMGSGNNAVDVMTTVSAPPSTVPGGAVTVPVVFANVGGTEATGVSYGLTLTPGLNPAQVSCAGGVTCVYDTGTGALTLTGLPGSLSPGQSVPVVVNYIAPVTPVTVTAAVNDPQDGNPGNNTANGTTTPTSTGSAPDVMTSIAPPATATPGAVVSVPVRFGNLGGVPAEGVVYTLTVPADLTGVSCPAPAICSQSGSTITVSNLPTTLNPGDWADMTLRYNAPVSGVVAITSNVGTTTAGDPNGNNSATGTTTVVTASTGADLKVTVQPPAKVAPGAVVNVPVALTNIGPETADGVTVSLKLPPGLSGVACTGGVACTYDGTTGLVTITAGVPTQLTPGQSVPFTLTYAAPGSSGTVPVEATASTTSIDPNTGNNKATGSTEVSNTGTQPDMTTTVSAPPHGAAGATVTVQVHYENTGGSQATGIGYSIVLPNTATNVEVRHGGALCTHDSGSGLVTGCGLPATRHPGEALDLVLTYTAPASGTVNVSSTVSSASDGNADNNVADGATAFTPAAASQPTPIPTLSQWGLIVLAMLMGLAATQRGRRAWPFTDRGR